MTLRNRKPVDDEPLLAAIDTAIGDESPLTRIRLVFKRIDMKGAQ